MKIPLIGPHGLGRFPQKSARRCENFYISTDQTAKAQTAWVLRLGLKLFKATAGVVRGWCKHGSYVYFVVADKLYRVDSAGTVSSALGTLTTNSSATYPYVSMVTTLYEVVIADGTRELFVYDTQDSAFTVVSSFSIESLIDTIARSAGSKTVTITTLSDHLGNTGNSALIAGASYAPNTTHYYNGTFTITRTAATTFTYAITGKPCVTIVGDGATATVTTATPHQLQTGDSVDIVDATTAGFNANSQTVTKTAETTFTYANATAGTDASGTGRILPPQPDPVVSGVAYVEMRTDDLTFQPTHVASMDGYTIANNVRESSADGVNKQLYFVSAGDDATTWDPTMFGAAQRVADDLKVPYSYGGNVYMLGEESTEAHFNSGSGDMPFQPTREAANPWGCRGPYTVCDLGDGVAWMGQRKNGQVTVLHLEGYRPEPIAPEWLEYQLEQASSAQLDAATAWSFRWQSHEFYGLTVGSNTWVYDDTVSKETKSRVWYKWGTSSGAFQGRFHIYAFGKHLFTDSTYGQILEADIATYTDLVNSTATAIGKVGVSGYINSEDKPVTHHRVQVDIAQPSGPGTLLLESSDDGGQTWTSHGSKSFSTTDTKLEWWDLGQADSDRAYRLTPTGDVSFCILDAFADVSQDDN